MNSGPRLSLGATGKDVARLQTLFVMMNTLGHQEIDGVFGSKTRDAVVDFQQTHGLQADGVAGNATWAKLPADPNTPVLRRGASGDSVSGLQKGLRKVYSPGSPGDPGLVDGVFGPKTEASVKTYQAERGIGSDGVVGPHSWWVPAGAAGATLASLAELTTV